MTLVDGKSLDYGGLAASDLYAEFKSEYTSQLAAVDLDSLRTREEQISFWVNLYNVLTIDSVIQFGIEESVAEGFLGILTFFEKAAYNIAGLRFSLSDIEHGILRANRGLPYLFTPQFASGDPRIDWVIPDLDPRIHFVLNCASQSCPPIGIYTPDRLDAQMDLAARHFIDHTVDVDPRRNKISISSIFRWYSGDFGGSKGIVRFLEAYLPDGERKDWIQRFGSSVRMRYQPYVWRINGVF